MGVEFINNPNDVEYVDEIDEILTNPQYVPIMDIDDEDDIDNDPDLDHSYMMHSPVGNWNGFELGDIEEDYGDNLDDDTLDDDPDFHNSDIDSLWCDDDDEDDESDGELRGVMMNNTFVLTGSTHLFTSEESSNTDSNDNEQSNNKTSAPEGVDKVVTTEKVVASTVCNDNSSDGEAW